MSSSFAALFALLFTVATGPAVAAEDSGHYHVQSMQDLRTSHILAHVPAGGDFEVFLVRDLAEYFARQGVTAPVVTFDLLREGPTQSGVSYPKFYVWVTVSASSGAVLEGVGRVAAIERTRFEITDFVSREQIIAEPESLDLVVPAALVDLAVRRARAP